MEGNSSRLSDADAQEMLRLGEGIFLPRAWHNSSEESLEDWRDVPMVWWHAYKMRVSLQDASSSQTSQLELLYMIIYITYITRGMRRGGRSLTYACCPTPMQEVHRREAFLDWWWSLPCLAELDAI